MSREEEIRAIVSGDHGDPFSFLGMHEEDGALVVRAFLPGAVSVEAISEKGASLGELEMLHPEGFFAGRVSAKERTGYRLRVGYGGSGSVMEDPYRFPPTIGDYDLYLFAEGTNRRIYEKLGAHPMTLEGVQGTSFAVWAPNARRVSVVGEFNGWDGRRHVMRKHPAAGVWEIFIPDVGEGALYKYEVKGPDGSLLPLKADPYGFRAEVPPATASIVHDLHRYEWGDEEWMGSRKRRNALDAPVSVYEVHLGSWRRNNEGYSLSYRELADELVSYVSELGYTHVEFLPVAEHPFYGSWGYQPVGMFTPTGRYGSPDDFRYLVDRLHQAGIGVIVDWVPAHFPEDAHGLVSFDGTHLYEHADPRRGRHADWGTLVYNYGRNEVKSFLISNAVFWLSEYHVDALRVDAVASMLYLDYSREPGEWVPNRYGGNEDLEAIDFLKKMNEAVYGECPGAATIAEESTAWPMVSRPTYMGGLGFGYKWNMGWMHDTLGYMSEDPVHRSYHHNELTFSLVYAFNENFILPLSHDEVVYGKGSIAAKMPGDDWQKLANVRLLYAYMYAHPGKQMLFMGGELAQWGEWNHDSQVEWHLLESPAHRGVRELVRDLNSLYRATPTLYEVDFEPSGFEWVEGGDRENSVVSFLRRARNPEDFVLVVCNFTPVVRHGYRLGVPRGGLYTEVLNTDAAKYGGSGVGNGEAVEARPFPSHGREYSLELTLPPLGALVLKLVD